jgi:hypothetical protein
MARGSGSFSKLAVHYGKTICPVCGGGIGPVTGICFDCHDAELRAAGVDLAPIREGRATKSGLVSLTPWARGRAA